MDPDWLQNALLEELVDSFYPYGVPEPSGLALLGLGVLCLAIKTRRGRKQATRGTLI